MKTINLKKLRRETISRTEMKNLNLYWNTQKICSTFGIKQVCLYNLEKSGWLKSYDYSVRLYHINDIELLIELKLIHPSITSTEEIQNRINFNTWLYNKINNN